MLVPTGGFDVKLRDRRVQSRQALSESKYAHQLMSLTTQAAGNTAKTPTQVQLGELTETHVKSLERNGHEMRQHRPNRQSEPCAQSSEWRATTEGERRETPNKTARPPDNSTREPSPKKGTTQRDTNSSARQHLRPTLLNETHLTQRKTTQRTRKPTDTKVKANNRALAPKLGPGDAKPPAPTTPQSTAQPRGSSQHFRHP